MKKTIIHLLLLTILAIQIADGKIVPRTDLNQQQTEQQQQNNPPYSLFSYTKDLVLNRIDEYEVVMLSKWTDFKGYVKQVEWQVWILVGIPIVYSIFIINYLRKLIHNKFKFLEYPEQIVQEEHKPFERVDRKNWKIWEIYLCGVFLLPFRLFLLFLTGILLALVNTIYVWTSDTQAEQSRGNRGFLKLCYRVTTKIWLVAFGACWIKKQKIKIREIDESYPEENYKDREDKAPIIISNHFGYLDTIYMVSTQYVPSLMAKKETQNMPLLGSVFAAIQCIFVDRSDRTNKDGVLEQIKDRCEKINQGKNYPSVLIFPEGTTTNSHHVLNFKRGAFANFQPIKMFCLKFNERSVSPYLCENVNILEHILLQFCCLYQTLESFEFETYFPDHLNLKNEEDWQVYAEKLQEIMAKKLNAQQSKSGFRNVKEYKAILDKKIEAIKKCQLKGDKFSPQKYFVTDSDDLEKKGLLQDDQEQQNQQQEIVVAQD